ncbi:hypothetical protein EV562_10521 [Streptomyces sp. BK208]|nr:hypothetical protein EV562_10521 [Streptomyces sp. BK208]
MTDRKQKMLARLVWIGIALGCLGVLLFLLDVLVN